MDALQLRDNAKHELMQIKDIETGFEYLSKVKGIEAWAKAEKKDAELQNIIAEQKIRTQRILGGLIREGQKRKEIASKETGNSNTLKQFTECNKQVHTDTPKSLSQIGITRNESSTFQKIADLPEDIFEKEIAAAKDESKKRIELTTSRLLSVAKDYEKEKQRKTKSDAGSKIKSVDVDFRLGDFEDVFSDLPDGSVDCIITDPPYPKEFIECWTKLSRFAKRVLKPNGFCIAYSGQMNLPEVINRMSENLTYYWTFSLLHTGSRQLINGRSLFCGWKPILVFQNGFKKLQSPFDDFIMGSGMEKTEHKWQQGKNELYHLINNFTNPGDLIVEPFAGGGTTVIAALELKRNIKAAEIDIESYNIAKERIWKNKGITLTQS